MKSNRRQAKQSGVAAIILTILVAAAMFSGVVVSAQAQTFTSLYSFQSTNGAYPQGLVQGTNGYLYGATTAGGDEFDSGTFFKISTSDKQTTICDFYDIGPCRDAQAPTANLVLGASGAFYGVDTNGQVFKITAGGKLTILSTSSNSVSVSPLVLASNGDFYGTMKLGGVYDNCFGYCGSVFKMTAGGKLTTLHSFCEVVQNGACTDGDEPEYALVEGSDGNLYGTTSGGGTDGVNAGYGTIFKITPTGTLTTIYNFPGYTQSSSALIEGADGNFYGTTADGGSGKYGAGGTFFSVTSSGDLTTLYNFCSLQNCADGQQPANIYLATDGNFYGITWFGGLNNQGTIFQFTPSGTLTTLHNFDGTDGSGPNGGGTLMQDTNGTFYGTMQEGGESWPTCSPVCDGTIFSLDMNLSPFVETLPIYGKVGAAVKILGTNLKGATSVTFNGIPATFKAASSSEITTKVPVGATSGVVQVVTPSGTLSGNRIFQVP
ncbi:MAG: choice-of-anchor tandem repeat GloVer-containing protein [Terriglobales bacterium]